MAGFRLEGIFGKVGEVDVYNNQLININPTPSLAGLIGVGSIVHDGSTGTSRVVRAGEISINDRLRIGMDTPIFQDTFNYTSQNTSVWNVAA